MNKKENGTIGFWTRPRLRVLWTLRPSATSGSKLAPYVGKLGEECISIAKDSIQPQVPLWLPLQVVKKQRKNGYKHHRPFIDLLRLGRLPVDQPRNELVEAE